MNRSKEISIRGLMLLVLATALTLIGAATSAATPASRVPAPACPPGSPPPTVQTGPATVVGPTRATLQGTVNPGGCPTSYRFQIGTTTAYGRTTAGVPEHGGRIGTGGGHRRRDEGRRWHRHAPGDGLAQRL